MLAAALLLLFAPFARAEGNFDTWLDRAGFGRLERMAGELGVDGLREFAQRAFDGESLWDVDALRDGLRRLGASVREGLVSALRAIAVPVLATLLLRLLLDRRDGPLSLLCRLSCAVALSTGCADALREADALMAALARMADVLSPVLAAALTLTGAGASAAALSPASTLCLSLIETALRDTALPLCAVAATVGVAGSLSERFRLDRLLALIRRFTIWGTGLMSAGFASLLAIEGHLASAQDGTMSRAVRGLIRGAIPFVGGSLSDSAGALVQSAALAKNAVGAAGMALALSLCAVPMTKLIVHALSLKLAAAISEPIADPGIVRVTACFGDVAGMLLAICGAGTVLDLLLCATCLGLFGGV